jgi:hypothetical protein
MLTFLMHTRTAWEDYFTGYPNIMQSKEYRTIQTPQYANVHVSNCLFISITSTANGGALSCTSVTILLVESSSFFTCKTSGQYGGAIYFSDSSGQSVLHEVCGYDCCSIYSGSGSWGQFSSIGVKNDASSYNYANYSSISRSVNENALSWYTLRCNNGKICFTSVNISIIKCYNRPATICSPYADANSVTCSLSYSSFADNNAAGYGCITFSTTGARYEIKSCNILRNTQVDLNSQGTIYTNGNVMIEGSCILENKATYIFRQGSSYTITLTNCTVDLTSNNGYLTLKSTVTKSFVLALNHMSTQNCHAAYDGAGTLTAIIQTPSSSKNQIRCYTDQKIVFLLRHEDVVSLISIVIFSFIHLDASNNPLF